MSAARELLQRARQAGLEISVANDRLKLRSPTKPPEDLLSALKAHKTELISMLSDNAETSAASGNGLGQQWSGNGPSRMDQ